MPIFWLWDVRDLLMAKEGSMNPYDVRPYDYGKFILPFNTTDIGGATYDSDSGLLYIQYRGLIGSKRPIRIPPFVAAYRISAPEAGEDTEPPLSLTSVTATAISASRIQLSWVGAGRQYRSDRLQNLPEWYPSRQQILRGL